MTAKKKMLLFLLPLAGIAAGALGHAAYVGRAPAPPRAPGEAPGPAAELAAALDYARRRIAALEAENAALRERPPKAEERPASPRAGAIDWSELVPLLRAVARADPNRGQHLDAADDQRLDDLLQDIAQRGLIRDEMQLQDVWRLPAVASGIALAFAREGGERVDDAIGEKIKAAMETIEAALPDEPLEIDLLAAAEAQLVATEEILARASSAATARRAVAEVAPLWRRRHWQVLRLGGMTKEALQELVTGMVDVPADARARVLEATSRMAEEFRHVRAELVRDHGEETLRAVLLEPGTAGPEEAVLAERRLRDDYPTAERRIRAVAAKHQARFEREYYRSLPPAQQEDYARIAATLMLFDLAE